MNTLFEHFNGSIELFESNRDLIITYWVEEADVTAILHKHDISTNTFADEFAYAVLDYFLHVARGEREIGDCPVMAKFLQFLRDKDITASELFVICSKFRKAMVNLAFKETIVTQELYNDIATIFDKNFAGVLESFGKTIKQAEQELDKTLRLLENYKQAIDAHSIVSLTDLKGTITYVNEAFCTISGYSEAELLGSNHNIVRHPEMSKVFYKSMWDTLQSGKIFHDVIRNRKKNGDDYYVDAVIVPLVELDGSTSGYISIRNDITENISITENALRAEEVALEAKELAQAAERSKDDFLAAMSHEIRTPLNAILGFVAILLKSKLPNKEKGYLNIIDNSGQALVTIINDILDFAKIRSGKFEIDPYECDPISEVENILDLFSSKMMEKGIEFIPYIDPDIPSLVRMDAVRIRQIVSNYLSNAVKFTKENGLVYVRVLFDTQRKVLSIYVQDSGIGIKRENLAKVFEAFSQEEESTSRKYGGTGLGLSISKSLAKLMDGQVGVDSIEGKGSTFYVHIPVTVIKEGSAYDWVDEVTILSKHMNAHQYKLLYKYCQKLNIKVHDEEAFCEIKNQYPIIAMSSYLLNLGLDESCLSENTFIVLDHVHSDYDDIHENIQRIFFPLTPTKLIATLAKGSGTQAIDEVAQTRGYKGHILVAEDNFTNQQLISILLEERGISFDMAVNGVEAVEKFKTGSYDLVLMDNNMPVMGGIEATQEIQKYESEQHLGHAPIVALTANATNSDKEMMLSSGMSDFLSKPIDVTELDRVFMTFLKDKK